jgi:hypothetical protein
MVKILQKIHVYLGSKTNLDPDLKKKIPDGPIHYTGTKKCLGKLNLITERLSEKFRVTANVPQQRVNGYLVP